jgi:hypothetical protein
MLRTNRQGPISAAWHNNDLLNACKTLVQVAAKLAADRSSRCLHNLKDTLHTLSVETCSKLTEGQQQVRAAG